VPAAYTPSSLADVIGGGLSNNDVIALRAKFRKFGKSELAFGWKPRFIRQIP